MCVCAYIKMISNEIVKYPHIVQDIIQLGSISQDAKKEKEKEMHVKGYLQKYYLQVSQKKKKKDHLQHLQSRIKKKKKKKEEEEARCYHC